MEPAPANSHDVRRVQAKAKRQLSQDDFDYFVYVLNEYWQYRNVDGLVLCLLSVLDTPIKLDLLNDVRDVIDEKDIERFDGVVPFDKMAHPPLSQQATLPRHARTTTQGGGAGGRQGGSSRRQEREPAQVRQVTLIRTVGQSTLGFSICGGRENGMGVFVSSVDPGSLAERSGLRVGDRLLDVNGMNFEHVAHSTAVKVLKSPGRVVLVVRPSKRPAGGRVNQLRVEEAPGSRRVRSIPDVSSTTPDGLAYPPSEGSGAGGSELDAHASLHALSELRMGGGSIDVRKVNLSVEPGHPLGIAIRGGKEHNVGIFISHVEEKSLAAKNGLQAGDQVLDVNGTSFLDMSHADAIITLKQNPLLMMTVKAMGKIPLAGQSTNGELKWIEPVSPTMEAEEEPVGRRSPSLHVRNRPPPSPDAAKRPGPEDATESPKRESKAKRFQDMLKGSRKEDDDDSDREKVPERGRRRSMTLPSRRSKSNTRDDDFEKGNRRRRSRSRSRGPDDSEKQDRDEDGRSSPKVATKSIGGLSAALGVGQRLVSSMKRRASSSGGAQDTQAAAAAQQAVANNQLVKSSPTGGRRSSTSTAVPSSDSPKLSRQDGDGSDASDTKPREQLRTLPGESGGGSPFFSRGLGSQVMLTSMAAQASRQAQQVLEQSAASCMTETECGALRLHLKRYEEDQNVVDFVTALLPLLNTPKKVELLRDIRSLVIVQHIQKFDELVSKREMEAMQERNRTRPAVGPGADAKDAKPAPNVAERGQLFSAIQSGRPQLRKVQSSPSAMEPALKSRPPAKSSGLFQGSVAQKMLERGRSIDEEQDHQRFRRKDSFVAWNDSHEGVRKRGSQKRHSFASEVLVELMKTKPKLGISIEGGVDTQSPEVRIQSIIDGGLAQEDGFLQPGFEIVAVDGTSVKGCTHAEAVARISEAFASERDILELLVIPEVD